MDLLTPTYGLLAFQVATVVSIMLLIAAWIVIALTNKMDGINKLIWLIVSLCLPLIGPILLFIYSYRSVRQSRTYRS